MISSGVHCHSAAQSYATARNSSCPDQTRWLERVSRIWLNDTVGYQTGCKMGSKWVKGGCKDVKPIVFFNVGANKGFAVASMLQHFTVDPGFTNMDWFNEIGRYVTHTYGVNPDAIERLKSEYCGACSSCHEQPSPLRHLTSSVDLDIHAFEIANGNVRWLRWAFAKFGIRASLVRAAATNTTARVKVPLTQGIEDFGDEKGAVRPEHAKMLNHGRNADCPMCRPLKCYEEGKCWQFLQGLPLDDYLAQEGLSHVHLISIDTEGHDALVLEGLRKSLAKGAVDVLEFEFNAVLGHWNYRSRDRRLLHDTVVELENNHYGCFWQDAMGCISPVSGACWKNAFEKIGWSNLVCARGTSSVAGRGKVKSTRSRKAGGEVDQIGGKSPLALLWELSDECYDASIQ